MLKSTGILALICLFAAPLAALGQTTDGNQQFAELGACKLVSGQQIEGCRLGYRTYGKLNAAGTNAVLFPTWFGGKSEDLREFVSAQGLVDPAKYFVILVDAFGNGVSSSPSNSTAQPGADFPAFAIRDMVNAEYRLATEILHLKHLHAVIGISMGGFQTFEWVVDYPGFMAKAVPIVGSPRPSSWDLYVYRSVEDAARNDPAWANGHYTARPALSTATTIMEMAGTTPANFNREHKLGKFGAEYAAMRASGILPEDANDWIAQIHAVIGQDIAHGGRMEDAAMTVKARMLIINGAQDHLVLETPAQDFAKLIGAKAFLLESDCAHSSFSCEARTLNPQVRAFLDGE